MSESKPAPTPEATPRWNQGLVDPLTIVDSSNGRVVAEISQRFAHDKGLGLAGEYARLIASAPELSERVRELREALQLVWDIWEENQYPQSGAIAARMTEIKPLIAAALKPRKC